MQPISDHDLSKIEAMAKGQFLGIPAFAHVGDTLLLVQEIRRLKEGKFTPEELQNLCHNLTQDDVNAFCKGCKDYQKTLFGNRFEEICYRCGAKNPVVVCEKKHE